MTTQELRADLDASHAALLAAVGTLTDRDFAIALDDHTSIIAVLATLAPAEREAVRTARAAIGAAARPLPASDAPRTRALPPQVMHDLAGARYETLLFLNQLSDEALDVRAGETAVSTLLVAIAERERAAAQRIDGRPPSEPR